MVDIKKYEIESRQLLEKLGFKGDATDKAKVKSFLIVSEKDVRSEMLPLYAINIKKNLANLNNEYWFELAYLLQTLQTYIQVNND